MGKGSKAKKPRKKGSLPELAGIPKRQPNGQARARADAPNDPRKTALQARVRHFGGKDTREGRLSLSGQNCGEQIGLVMQHSAKEAERTKLWQTFQAWSSAETSYRSRYLGASEHAKGASIAMVPDRVESDTSHSVDLRDPEQKDRDAVAGWMRWKGYLGHLQSAEVVVLHQARRGEAMLWESAHADDKTGEVVRGRPTLRGLFALASLRKLHAVVEGRK